LNISKDIIEVTKSETKDNILLKITQQHILNNVKFSQKNTHLHSKRGNEMRL